LLLVISSYKFSTFTLYISIMNYTIRKIEPKDNLKIASVIRNVFEELDAPKVGTAYADPHLNSLSEVYQAENEIYFVVVETSRDLSNQEDEIILGGCGVGNLIDAEFKICELQKMYLLKEARGKGIAQELMQKCLEFAKQAGYDKCYLETLPFMKAAQKLYVKSGFTYIDAPKGSTGHNACDVFMIKDL
jgi:putative acetyltransferase